MKFVYALSAKLLELRNYIKILEIFYSEIKIKSNELPKGRLHLYLMSISPLPSNFLDFQQNSTARKINILKILPIK